MLTYNDYRNVDLRTDVMETASGEAVKLPEVPLPEMISFRNSVASEGDWVLADYLRQFVPEVFLSNLGAAIAHSIDPAMNSVGVEAAIRVSHETLSGLDAETFAHEINLARACEFIRPGYLAACAREQGMDQDYCAAAKYVQEATA